MAKSVEPDDLGKVSDEDIAKFLAVAVEASDDAEKPFDVVSVHIPSTLPWWAWASLGVVLAGVFLVVVSLPVFRLNARTERLSAGSFADAQAAMRELIVSGDGHTIDRLFEIASSPDKDMVTRLRAIDALSMIREPAADRALLRLEVAGQTDETVRRAVINARRQRQASQSGPHAD